MRPCSRFSAKQRPLSIAKSTTAVGIIKAKERVGHRLVTTTQMALGDKTLGSAPACKETRGPEFRGHDTQFWGHEGDIVI